MTKYKVKYKPFKFKTLRKYPKAYLETCGDKKHKKGCYIHLNNNKITNSEELIVLIDLDKNQNIVGIDLECE